MTPAAAFILAYLAIGLCFAPFAMRTTLEGWQDECGRAGIVEIVICLFGGLCLAAVWPLIVLGWLITRKGV